MINNRQNGRRRGRGGQRPGNGGNPGRADNGSRIDNRARGNASQLYEKYKSLAADAQRQGDRVNTEYYLQFADHYFRVLSENRPRFDEQQRARRDEEDEFGEFGGGNDEFGQEGEPVRADQYQPQQQERPRYDDRPRREERPRDDRQSGDRQVGDRQAGDRQRDERPRQDSRPQRDDTGRDGQRYNGRDGEQRDAQSRDVGQRDNGQREGGQRDNGQRENAYRENGAREIAPREGGQRDNGQREERRPRRDAQAGGPANARATAQANGGDARPEFTPDPVEVTVLAPNPVTEEASTTRAADMEAAPPRRRGRPRREDAAPVSATAPDEPSGLDADRLPPSLSVSTSAQPAAGTEENPVVSDVERPRRRRRAAAPVEEAPAN